MHASLTPAWHRYRPDDIGSGFPGGYALAPYRHACGVRAGRPQPRPMQERCA